MTHVRRPAGAERENDDLPPDPVVLRFGRAGPGRAHPCRSPADAGSLCRFGGAAHATRWGGPLVACTRRDGRHGRAQSVLLPALLAPRSGRPATYRLANQPLQHVPADRVLASGSWLL